MFTLLKRRKRGLMLLFVSIVLACVMFSGGLVYGQKSPYEGTTLRFISTRTPYMPPIAESFKEIAGQMGMKLEVIWYDWDDLRKKVILDATMGVSSWDITTAESQFLLEFAQAGALLPLDDLIETIGDPDLLAMDDFLDFQINAGKYKGKTWAFPSLNSSIALAYRTDLFNDPIEKAAFSAKYGYSLQPPETYEQFYDVCEFFTRKKGDLLAGKPLDGDFYGTVHSNRRGMFLWHDYMPYAVAFGADVIMTPAMRPTFNSPESIAAGKFYVSLAKFQPPGHINMTSGEATSIFAAGHAAVQIEFTDRIVAMVLDPQQSKVADKVGLTLSPSKEGVVGREHASVFSLNGLGIYGLSKNKEAAYKLLERFLSPENQKKVAIKYKEYLPSRYSSLSDPEVLANHPEAKILEEIARRGYPFTHPLFEGYAASLDIANTAINEALTGNKSVEEAYNAAQKELIDLFTELGYLKPETLKDWSISSGELVKFFQEAGYGK